MQTAVLDAARRGHSDATPEQALCVLLDVPLRGLWTFRPSDTLRACVVGPNGSSGSNGHTADNNSASGGSAPDINGAAGANGGLCAGNNCVVASSPGSHGVCSQACGLDGSGGGGGSVQVVASAATVSCE